MIEKARLSPLPACRGARRGDLCSRNGECDSRRVSGVRRKNLYLRPARFACNCRGILASGSSMGVARAAGQSPTRSRRGLRCSGEPRVRCGRSFRRPARRMNGSSSGECRHSHPMHLRPALAKVGQAYKERAASGRAKRSSSHINVSQLMLLPVRPALQPRDWCGSGFATPLDVCRLEARSVRGGLVQPFLPWETLLRSARRELKKQRRAQEYSRVPRPPLSVERNCE